MISRGPNQLHSDPGCYSLVFTLWWKCIQSTVILIVCRSPYTTQMSIVFSDTQGNIWKSNHLKSESKSYLYDIQWYRLTLPHPVDRNLHSFFNHIQCLPGDKVGFPWDLPHYLISHMQFIQLSLILYKHQRQLKLSHDYVSWWTAKIISSCLLLLPTTLANIPSWKYPQNRSVKGATFSQYSLKIQTENSNSGIKLPS